jgi:hypothetical protein
MAVRFVYAPGGIREILRSPGVAAALMGPARRIAEQAKQTAPVLTGKYQASIEATAAPTKTRARVRVTARVPYAIYVEAATRNLGRAVDAGHG